MTVTADLPVYDHEPSQAAFAKPQGGAAWGPVLEKAIAGADWAWTSDEMADWAKTWDAVCANDASTNVDNPRCGPPPTGYVRINQGSTAWERAQLLTQLTGQPAAVVESPERPADLAQAFAQHIRDGKPLLVAAREEKERGEELPHNLKASHVYEVVAVEEDKISLHNPWQMKQPDPMSPEQFAANIKPVYATLA